MTLIELHKLNRWKRSAGGVQINACNAMEIAILAAGFGFV
jgi:hypothetical protein